MYKMKKGGSFPDLNKDGKITKADILKGRGVIAKRGTTVKKAQKGIRVAPEAKTEPGNPYYVPRTPKDKRRIANTKSAYESSTAPKVEYQVPTNSRRNDSGGYRTSGGQTVSVDTVGLAAGNRRFPTKVTRKDGTVSYYPINRSKAKTAVKISQDKKAKNGMTTKKINHQRR